VNVEYVPLLRVQREIYSLPRGMERFREYLATMLNESGDELALPLTGMNPMAKEHAPALLDRYLELGTEDAVARAVASCTLDGAYRATLVLGDDLKGGWTNRYASEFTNRFRNRPMLTRGWIVGMLWTSEEPSVDRARVEMVTAVHRAAHIERHGHASTLRECLRQEGHALRGAGVAGSLAPEELEYTRAVLDPLLDSTDMGTITVALFGDAAADSMGFRRLGLSPRAGLELAVAHKKD
jgi:hypothetical protein